MRNALRELIGQPPYYPDHAGLAYDVYAPLDNTQKLDPHPETRNAWFRHLERISIPEGYKYTLERWVQSLEGSSSTQKTAYRTLGRLLVGHGNAAPSEVGITLHRTWGVPMIPGSSIKGLLSHYIATTYGPDGSERQEEYRDRAPFKGLGWKDRRIVEAPGEFHGWLFGSPEIDEGKGKAQKGSLVMHDALWLPGKETKYIPLKRDILTVHQKDYYRSFPPQSFPNDYDDPTPVSFLSVGPGARFLFTWSLTGSIPYADPKAISARVERYLQEALANWGIGGKISAGYGRMVPCSDALPQPKRARSGAVKEFEAWLEARKNAGVNNRPLLTEIEAQWLERLRQLPAQDKKHIDELLRRHITSPKARADVDRVRNGLHQP